MVVIDHNWPTETEKLKLILSHFWHSAFFLSLREFQTAVSCYNNSSQLSRLSGNIPVPKLVPCFHCENEQKSVKNRNDNVLFNKWELAFFLILLKTGPAGLLFQQYIGFSTMNIVGHNFVNTVISRYKKHLGTGQTCFLYREITV